MTVETDRGEVDLLVKDIMKMMHGRKMDVARSVLASMLATHLVQFPREEQANEYDTISTIVIDAVSQVNEAMGKNKASNDNH